MWKGRDGPFLVKKQDHDFQPIYSDHVVQSRDYDEEVAFQSKHRYYEQVLLGHQFLSKMSSSVSVNTSSSDEAANPSMFTSEGNRLQIVAHPD